MTMNKDESDGRIDVEETKKRKNGGIKGRRKTRGTGGIGGIGGWKYVGRKRVEKGINNRGGSHDGCGRVRRGWKI